MLGNRGAVLSVEHASDFWAGRRHEIKNTQCGLVLLRVNADRGQPRPGEAAPRAAG